MTSIEGKRYVQLWWGNLQGTPLKCIVAYRRIILKCILKQEDGLDQDSSKRQTIVHTLITFQAPQKFVDYLDYVKIFSFSIIVLLHAGI